MVVITIYEDEESYRCSVEVGIWMVVQLPTTVEIVICIMLGGGEETRH